MTSIRTLDLSQVVAGPLATHMLAEQGAQVVTAEPVHGEQLRAGRRGGLPPLSANNSRGKRSIAVDGHQTAGREIVRELAVARTIFVGE